MLTGLKGVKYGLQPGARAKEKAPLKKLSVFADEEEEEEAPLSISAQIARQAAQKSADVKVAKAHAAAMAEDPSVFAYDDVYDSIQQQRVVPKQQEKIARKSRYIESLLDKAKDREREQDIVYERKLAKEREAEDYLFGDKDKFVTAAYKRKLQEDKLWQEKDKAREEREAAQEADKVGHMGNFYKNVLTNNEAFGTTSERKSSREEKKGPPTSSTNSSGQKPKAVDPEWETARKAREEAERKNSSSSNRPHSDATAAAVKEKQSAPASASGRPAEERQPSQPKSLPAERHSNSASHSTAVQTPLAQKKPGEEGRHSASRKASEAAAGGPGGVSATEEKDKEEEKSSAAAPIVGSVPAVNSAEEREAKLAAARERLLARKRKAPSQV